MATMLNQQTLLVALRLSLWMVAIVLRSKAVRSQKVLVDAGCDKKGVASGTIEAEAKFISASPTVEFEGKGVCRLSDQMTMNKANTMCLGGAQNPSVSVTEEQEGTYTVDLYLSYSDGEPVQGCNVQLFDKGLYDEDVTERFTSSQKHQLTSDGEDKIPNSLQAHLSVLRPK